MQATDSLLFVASVNQLSIFDVSNRNYITDRGGYSAAYFAGGRMNVSSWRSLTEIKRSANIIRSIVLTKDERFMFISVPPLGGSSDGLLIYAVTGTSFSLLGRLPYGI